MSVEHGSIEPILTVKEKQLRFSEAASRLEVVQPILGTPENISKPNLGLRIDLPGLTIREKIDRKVKLGELRGRIGEKILQIRNFQSRFQVEIDRYLFDSGRELAMIDRLTEQGLLDNKEVIGIKSEYEILRQKLTATSLDKSEIVEAVKPVEPVKIEPVKKPEKSKKKPVKITYFDGINFTEQDAVASAKILKYLAESYKSYTPEEIENLNKSLEYKPVKTWKIAEDIYGGRYKHANVTSLKDKTISLAKEHGWELKVSEVSKNERRQGQSSTFTLKKIKKQPEEKPEQLPEQLKVKEYQMTKEEAAMFGSLIKLRDNVQLFGLTQDIRTEKPLFTLELDQETRDLCDQLIGGYDFNLEGKTENWEERLRLLREQAVDKLKRICEGGVLGEEILDQQSQLVRDLYTRLFCIYEEILGDDLCNFLTESPNQKKVIDKAMEEKDKSSDLLLEYMKYWVVPSASFPERIKRYLESKEKKTAEPEVERNFLVSEPEKVAQAEEKHEEPKPTVKKVKKSKVEVRVELIEEAYPKIREITNRILTRWEEQGKDPEQRVGGNVITDLFRGCGVSAFKRTTEKMYLEKKYAESGPSNDHHVAYNQFEIALLLCWVYCNQGKNWNKGTVTAIKQIIKEEIEKRKSNE